jgi:hypothetical protein
VAALLHPRRSQQYPLQAQTSEFRSALAFAASNEQRCEPQREAARCSTSARASHGEPLLLVLPPPPPPPPRSSPTPCPRAAPTTVASPKVRLARHRLSCPPRALGVLPTGVSICDGPGGASHGHATATLSSRKGRCFARRWLPLCCGWRASSVLGNGCLQVVR